MKRYFSLYKYLTPYKRNIVLYVFAILLSIIFSVASISMLFPFMQIIFLGDDMVVEKVEFSMNSASFLNYLQYTISQLVQEHSKMYALTAVCILLIVSIILKNAFLYLSAYLLSPMRTGMVVRLRDDLFAKILTLPIGYFNEQRKGDLMSRMTNDTWELENTTSSLLDGLIKDPLSVLFYLMFLIFLSPELSLVLLVLLPVAGIIIGKVSKSLKKQSNIAAEKSAEGLSILEETLGGIRIIKAYTFEKITNNKFLDINNQLFDAKNKINRRRELASPMSEVLGIMVLCVILWFGGRLILTGDTALSLDGAGFITYIGIFSQIISPAKALSNTFYNLRKGEAALNRINEVLDTQNTIINKENGKKFDTLHTGIEFKNVGFKYDDHVILDHINLNIPKGKKVALVGSSGAGKSTLADLIPRFHDVSSGELLIDGINIKDYELNSIRHQISVVTQEAILFNDSIFNNIAMGNQHATLEEVMNAAKIANAHNFIMKKENGYDTNVGDRGTKLSGGERQRITIARAILKNPPILILDEATSALDTESERLVQEAINNIMDNRTTVVIAHRLSTIKNSDEIIVMDKGAIVERGNHEALIAHGGIYKRLVELQEVK
ncbi:ABC transporter ATP-binding protein [Polluticaenibacter yanchengensis]|uniref:ABC transporter ATP-binding protein n=1 Tax=Polluticaenibacter yanchengensis TaxID=3014562 RepID=A0ABT4ULP0_9BACT|nr:ABC transporter ATP-binding protein [Chitinophagaceae bacterium LY-5]